MSKLKTIKSYLEFFEKEHTCKTLGDLGRNYVLTIGEEIWQKRLKYALEDIILGMNLCGCPMRGRWVPVKRTEDYVGGIGFQNFRNSYRARYSREDLEIFWRGKSYFLRNGGYRE